MSSKWDPDVVVGIDFGMTCTGVAYSTGPDWHDARIIQNWPGLSGSELRNKVQTVVAYQLGSRNVASWGFLTDVEANDANIFDLFKLYLDPSFKDQSERPISAIQARACFRDYLRCVRKYVEQMFEETIPYFDEKHVEYVFSTPTTWTSPAMIHQIENCLKEAGFADGHRRRIKMGLTEAEAAAVYASKQSHRMGEVILVCDAGGGTTDLNILKVRETYRRHTGLDQLIYVEGRAIGSALIDWKVRQWIIGKLEGVRDQMLKDPEECAILMMQHRFETFKCSFGQAGSNIPSFTMPVPDLPPLTNLPDASIFDSRLHLNRDEFQAIFDEQVDGIYDLIFDQVNVLHDTHPQEQIDYVVLSGGLGSSAYVKSKLRNRCENELGLKMPCASGMKFLTVQNPQVAVVLGLVNDRIQELDTGARVFKERCARNSYGVICRELYRPMEHMGEDVKRDPRDGKKYADNQITWLIKKGQTVSPEHPIQHNFTVKRNPGQEHQPWQTDIVVSELPRGQLPRSLKRAGAKNLCTIVATLDSKDVTRKNHQWYKVGRSEYSIAEYTVKVLINPADMKFQIWSKDHQRISRDHDAIEVKWDPPQREPPSVVDMQDSSGVYKA